MRLKLFQSVTENAVYGLGNSTELVSNISPAVAIPMTLYKFGSRVSKTYFSYCKGGLSNPTFYLNAGSSALSATSGALQCGSYVARYTCPPLALPLYGGSVACSATADVLDNCQIPWNLFG